MNQIPLLSIALATSVFSLGLVTSRADAASLVPQQEGEINVGLGSALGGGNYLDINSLFESIVSEEDETTGTQSRLFVDKAGTANNYGSVSFQAFDVGTTEQQESFWFRPVAMRNATTPLAENGQLEVGTFTFNFVNPIAKLLISWFDVEDVGTRVLAINGQDVNNAVPPGENKNIQEQLLSDVSSITLKFGNAQSSQFGTGDGVLAQFESTASVPEPGANLGFGVLAAAGAVALYRRQTSLKS